MKNLFKKIMVAFNRKLQKVHYRVNTIPPCFAGCMTCENRRWEDRKNGLQKTCVVYHRDTPQNRNRIPVKWCHGQYVPKGNTLRSRIISTATKYALTS